MVGIPSSMYAPNYVIHDIPHLYDYDLIATKSVL